MAQIRRDGDRMAEEDKGFRFACPYCGQHLETDSDMVGLEVECPFCSRNILVSSAAPVIKVLKRRRRFTRKHLKWALFAISVVAVAVVTPTLWRIAVRNGLVTFFPRDEDVKSFEGVVMDVKDDGVLIVLDKANCTERKVRLDKIKVHDNARKFISRRRTVEVRVTYREQEGEYVRGIVWEKDNRMASRSGVTKSKSLNDILVDEKYASYDIQ